MPGLRSGSRRLDRALREGQARLARHFAAIERADPIDVHQARVASRRLRSLLRTFKASCGGARVSAYRRDLGRLARRLGELRELDVLAAQPGMRAQPVAQALAAARAAGVRRLHRRLRAEPALWQTGLEGPPPASLGLDPDLGDRQVVQPVRRRWRRIERLLECEAVTPEVLHELRIKLKNLRYALETIADMHAEEARVLDSLLRAAQSVLGDERDASSARAWLPRSGLPPSVVSRSLVPLERKSRRLAARRPAVLSNLRQAGRRWYRATR
ncbi:MAG TPA: CHAD domain-containing protein [Steroidobacteraceae bacterium]